MRGTAGIITLSLIVATFAFALPRAARAEPRCDDETIAWTRACAAKQGVALELLGCPTGVTLVEVRPQGAPGFSVELSRRPGSFRSVNGISLSPIGQFTNWSDEPAARRAAFDALAECVAAGPPRTLVDAPPPPPPKAEQPKPTPPRAPWLLLGAVLAFAAGLLGARPAMPRPRPALAWAAAGIGSVVLCLLLRRALQPGLFLHQNGSGPLWVEFAAQGYARDYGPGWPEVFHWMVRDAPRADRALVLGQEAGAALVPLGLFLGTRALGAQAPIAAAIAGIAVIDPMCMRMARSESYLATILTLLSLAASALMLSPTAHSRRQTLSRLVTFLGAGLLVAQAARIHPLAWIPAALLPLVLLIGNRSWADRLRRAAMAAAVIAAVVVATSLRAMLATLQSGLGTAFLPGAGDILLERVIPALLVLGVTCLLFVSARTRPVAAPVLVLVAVLEASSVRAVLAGGSPLIDAAWVHCFLPLVAAASASLLSHEKLRPRWGAALVLVVFAAHAILERRAMYTPTDVAEQAWCQEWRETLPRNAEVAWLGGAGQRLLSLPLYGRSLPHAAPFSPDETPRYQGSGPRYYYRGSLCATPEGADHCAAFERSHRLRLLAQRSLAGVTSIRWRPLPERPIEVQLFAVE